MAIQAGLVGLPNVGKSTLFNALTQSSIPAENYPFCTIDPHLAITQVPDIRIQKLQKLYNSETTIPATVQFVDIAGLVKGAASGEGLGNQFLSHIREVDLILHVVRCFEDTNIIHTNDTIDPLEDYHIISAELMLKDIDSVHKRLARVEKEYKAFKPGSVEFKEMHAEYELLKAIYTALDAGDAAQVRALYATATVPMIPLLSAKNFLIIANIAEAEIDGKAYEQNRHYQSLVTVFGKNRVIPVCAKIAYELSQLDTESAQEMMGLLGLSERSLDTIIKKTYDHLGLITFFTCGPKEIHAWPIKKGISVRKAAGEIHSDLERGFIKAEIFNTADLLQYGSIAGVRDHGKFRTEGQEYLVADGDIINIKFNV